MKRILLLFCFFVAFGCKKKQDNLEHPKLPHYFNEKVNLEVDSLKHYLGELEKIPKENLSDSLKAEYSYIASRFNYKLGKYDKAIDILNYVTSFTKEKIKSDREFLFFRALQIVYFRKKHDYLNGEKINEKILSLLEDDDYRRRAFVYKNKHQIKVALEKYEEALIEGEKASKMFLRAADTTNYAISQLDKAVMYSALDNQKKAYDVLYNFKYENHLETSGKIQLHASLGYYYSINKLYDKAIASYNRALIHTKGLENKSEVKQRSINNYINLADSYIGLKKYNIAQKYIDSIFSLGLNNIEYSDQRGALKKSLEISHFRKENMVKVMAQLDSIFKYQDKNYSERINSELKASKVAFEKEIALEKEKREAERNQYILAAFLLLALVVGILVLNFYRQRRFKIEQDNFLLHQRLLRSQMNPHFTFNSLSLIKNNIEEDKDQSVKYIQKFSKLLRGVFENSTKDYVPIEDELESLENYIELQQFRFEGKFNYTIEKNLGEEDEVLIPPMLLQPFVENAIIHGFRKNDVTGNLNIHLNLEGKYIDCIIEDDGVGIDENGLNKKSSVKLIDEFLKKMTGKGIVIVNKNTLNTKEKGTRVELKIPYKLF